MAVVLAGAQEPTSVLVDWPLRHPANNDAQTEYQFQFQSLFSWIGLCGLENARKIKPAIIVGFQSLFSWIGLCG